MENSSDFFIFTCECNTEYSPAQTKTCPVCSKSHVSHKELKFDTQGFLERVLRFQNEKRTDCALDLILDAFHNFWNKYDLMTDILQRIDVKNFKNGILVGFLMCTFKFSESLPEHAIFFKKVYDEYLSRGKTPEEAKRLFQGLEGAGNFWERMESYGATGMIWGPKPGE